MHWLVHVVRISARTADSLLLRLLTGLAEVVPSCRPRRECRMLVSTAIKEFFWGWFIVHLPARESQSDISVAEIYHEVHGYSPCPGLFASIPSPASPFFSADSGLGFIGKLARSPLVIASYAAWDRQGSQD